jgi:hypothetical protein
MGSKYTFQGWITGATYDCDPLSYLALSKSYIRPHTNSLTPGAVQVTNGGSSPLMIGWSQLQS